MRWLIVWVISALWLACAVECAGAAAATPSHQCADSATCLDADGKSVKSRHVMFVSIAMRGHTLPLLRIAREMKDRGYRVSFATHESGREWVVNYGLPFVSAGRFPITADDLRSRLKTMTRDTSNFRGILTMFNDIYVASARPMYDALLPQLNATPPDLVVMDIATIGAQDLVHRLQIPYIINSPSIMFDLGSAPSYIPAWGTGFSVHMSLWNRCMNILFPRLLSVALTPPFMQLNKDRWELQLKPYRSQHDVYKGARVILNTAVGLDYAQPLSPLVEAVGPILPIDLEATLRNRDEKQFSTFLKSWLDHDPEKSNSFVVYLNLGTMSYIDIWQAEALVDGLTMKTDEPHVKVLWVLPTDQRAVLPSDLPPTFKVKSPSHVSHLEILSHPSVRLVISHCGMVSAQEALIFQKPLLCIPFLVDQPDVAARVVDSGAGLALDKNRLSAEDIHESAVEILTNSSFQRAAARVGRLLKRAGGTDRAIALIDGALQYGHSHLETIDLSQPWHKVAMLDVWTVYAAVFCLLAVAIRVIWLVIYFAAVEVFTVIGGVIVGPPMAPEVVDAAKADKEKADDSIK